MLTYGSKREAKGCGNQKVSRDPEYKGAKLTIRCLEYEGGACPAGDFLDSLEEKDRSYVDATFEMLGESRFVRNRERFKKLEGSDGIFAVKRYQIRIVGFFTPHREFLVMFGLIKKGNKYKRRDIDRAEAIKNDYFSQMEKK